MAVGFTARAANNFLDEHTNQSRGHSWVQLHTGDPGGAGTSNVASNSTRKQMFFTRGADGSGGRISNRLNVAWNDAEVTATETYSFITLWSAATGGTFGGSGPLTAAEVDRLNESFRIPTGSYTLAFNIAA